MKEALDRIDFIRHRARLAAAYNPIGFYVTVGCTLPVYLAYLDEAEAKLRELL